MDKLNVPCAPGKSPVGSACRYSDSVPLSDRWAYAPAPAAISPSVAARQSTPQTHLQTGPSDLLHTTVAASENDLAFQLLSTGLNPRIGLLWPLENANDGGEGDTDSLAVWGWL